MKDLWDPKWRIYEIWDEGFIIANEGFMLEVKALCWRWKFYAGKWRIYAQMGVKMKDLREIRA